MRTIKFSDCKCQVRKGEFNINDIPLDCKATWGLISSGHTVGVFQLEKNLGQDWARKVKPDNIEELAALTALLRPGPLESQMTKYYVDIKFGHKKNEYLHPLLKPILDATYCCLVYQEQAIKIAVDIAGFSLEAADDLRAAIGKKKPELMAKLKNKFIEGANTTKQIGPEVSEEIFGWIEKCQRYCVAGDTIIRRPNGDRFLKSSIYSVEHMYCIKNDIEYAKGHGHAVLRRKWNRLGYYGMGLSLNSDKRVRPNIIRDIQPAGTQQLYRLILKNGESIRVTAQHKFPTIYGEKTLEQLKVGDSLYLCGKYEQSDFRAINRFSNQTRNSKRKYGHLCGFPKGAKNPCYTNGSYTNFKNYKNKRPDVCEQCGATKCRIETAHWNGNRSDSSPENLAKLCVYCHKKYDYQQGRVKRSEKGYPVEISQIASIQLDKIEKVWNVTMDGPHHNFVINNDIITSNSFNKSHAISYGMIAYQTAWMKAHFPCEFFVSYLTYSNYKSDPKEEIYKLVQDSRLFGIKVLPPDIRHCNIHFKIVDKAKKNIAFGLAHIKGVGQSAIQKIVDAGGDMFETWSGFLQSVPSLHRNVGESLIKAGACDCYGLSRSVMLRELQTILGTTTLDENGKKKEVKGLTAKERDWFFKRLSDGMKAVEILIEMSEDSTDGQTRLNQMNKSQLTVLVGELIGSINKKAIGSLKKAELVKMAKDGGYVDQPKCRACSTTRRREIMLEKSAILLKDIKDTNRAKAMAERHFLGISLSCSPADDADDKLSTHTCLDIKKAGNKQSATICAVIDNVKHVKTKKGRNPGQSMCFLTISDSTYSIDHAVVFPDVFRKIKSLCKEDLIVLVYGNKQKGSFIVSDIQKLI